MPRATINPGHRAGYSTDLREVDKRSSPEAELFLSVVARCWEDAFVCSNVTMKNTDRKCAPDMVRAEARRWFLLDFGEWKADREDVCLMAGLDPDALWWHESSSSRTIRRLCLPWAATSIGLGSPMFL